MKSTQKAFIVLAVFLLACIGLLSWSVWFNHVKAEKLESRILKELSADDLKTIIASEAQGNPQALAALNNAPEQRQKVLESLRGLLALAAEARRAGIADEPETKAQLELQRKVIVARAYDQAQNQGAPAPPFGSISAEEAAAFYNSPAHETEFQKAIDLQTGAMKAAGQPVPKIEGETLKRAKDSFAKLSIAYEKAEAEHFLENHRDVQLQTQLQESLVLAREYSEKRLAKQVEPTKEEIAAFVNQHPEYDPKKQREKAEQVLARAKSGEDFAALAAQFSQDPGSKDKGGLYEDVSQGSFLPEFEAAALALEPGQISPNLVETQYGYHIIKLENKKSEKDKEGKDSIKFSVRHILLQSKFPAPGSSPFGQPQMMSGEEIARAQLEEEKRQKLIDELVARNDIKLPADFTVDVPPGAPETPELMPGMPHGEGGVPPGAENAKPTGVPKTPKKK